MKGFYLIVGCILLILLLTIIIIIIIIIDDSRWNQSFQQYYSSVFYQEAQNAEYIVPALRILFVVISTFPVFSPHDERIITR